MVELCPELKDCIVDIGNGIRLIKNKFLTTIYIRSENDEDLYNKPYRVRRELAQKYLEEENFDSFIFIHERPFRLEALVEVLFSIKKEDLFRIVEYVWTDSEDPCVNLEVWKYIFNYCEELGVLEDSKRDLPEKFTIYRGTRAGIEDIGISWTLDASVAKVFSERFYTKRTDKQPIVKVKEVKKEDIFLFTDARGEKEVILK